MPIKIPMISLPLRPLWFIHFAHGQTLTANINLEFLTHLERKPQTSSDRHQIMTRGEAHQTKVHYKGKDDDFVVLVDDAKSARDWKTDKSIPLTRVCQFIPGIRH
jgi:hypothetical protein